MAENTVILDLQVNGEAAVQSIQKYRAEIEALKKSKAALKQEVESGKKTEEQAEAEEIKITATIKERQAAVRALENQLKKQIAAEQANSGSLVDMRKQLAALTSQYDSLSQAERESASGTALRDKINEVTTALKNGEEATQRYQRNVGNYENSIKSALAANIPFVNTINKMSSTLTALSAAFGTNTAATNANAAANSANATATAAAAAGMEAEATAAAAATTTSTAATGAAVGLGGGLKILTSGVRSLSTALLQLLANPIVAIIAAIAAAILILIGIVKKVIDQIKQNEKQMAALQQILAPIRVLVDAVSRVFEKLGEVVLAVVGAVAKAVTAFTDFVGITKDASKEAEEYARHEREVYELTLALRKLKVDESKIDLENSELRAKVAERDKYTATERIAMLNKVIDNEKAVAAKKKELAETNLRLLREEAARTANSSEMNDKLAEAEIAVNKATQDYNETLRTLNKQLATFRNEEAEEAKKEAEERKRRYEEAIKQRKEQVQKETEAVRAMEDAIAANIADAYARQRAEINLSYDRQIADLKKRLEEEKNLTITAKSAINRQIVELELAQAQAIDNLNAERIKEAEEREKKIIGAKLATIAKGSAEELALRLELLGKQRDAELAAATESEELKAAIREKYAAAELEERKKVDDERLKQQQQAVASELESRMAQIENAYLQEVTAENATAVQKQEAERTRKEAELQATLEARKAELDAIHQLDTESEAEFNQRRLEAENAYLEAQNELNKNAAENRVQIEQSKTEALLAFSGALQNAVEVVGESNKAAAIAAKVIALADVAIKSGQAIADVTAANAAGDPYTYAIRVATAIATVTANMTKAVKDINSAKFATGGYISGKGSGTSDSIPAWLSNGESVINAKSTAMFGGLLSAINMAGGGVPIQVADTVNSAENNSFMLESMKNFVSLLPNPVVSVEDINEGIRRVGIIDNNSIIS